MMNIDASLASELIKKGVLKNPRLIEAFRAVDRKKFLPDGFEKLAYADEPLPIGEGQTISQPWTVAFMLELLGPQPEEHILEIGYGSGWQTALIAATGAHVYAVERIPRLCEFGKKNVERFLTSLPSSTSAFGKTFGVKSQKTPNVEENADISPARQSTSKPDSVQFFCRDGAKGLPEIAERIGGFDKIIVAAAIDTAKIPLGNKITDTLPLAWKDQLKIGGRIITPIGHAVFLFIKKAHNQFDEREYSGFTFVPLVEGN